MINGVREIELQPHLQTRSLSNELLSTHQSTLIQAMTESVMEWVGPGKHRETIKSWTILVSYVTEEIRYAYRCEVKRRRVNTSSGTGSNRSSTSSSPGPTMASRPFEPPETEEEVLTVTF